MHATELVRPALAAEVAAARLYCDLPATPASYVSSGHLGLTAATEVLLHEWPTRDGSVFGLLRRRGPIQDIVRPNQLIESAQSPSIYSPLESVCDVHDALAVSFPVEGCAWAAILLLACDRPRRFTEEQLNVLYDLRTPLRRVVRRGYFAEIAAEKSYPSTAAPTVTQAAPVDAGLHEDGSELVDRLSQTERQVLSHLLAKLTEREVAERLDRSPHTVHVHVKSIYRKLNVTSRRELLNMFDVDERRQ
ncbi:MAG: helix-turn-helix transcriptional regulator [Phycisphaeraceae bacterium]